MSELNGPKSNYIFKCGTCGKAWMQETFDPYKEKVICPDCNHVTGYTGYTEKQWATINTKDENTKSNVSKLHIVSKNEEEIENGVAHALKITAVISCIILIISAISYGLKIESFLYLFVGIILSLVAVLPMYAFGEVIQLLQDILAETKKTRKDFNDSNKDRQ